MHAQSVGNHRYNVNSAVHLNSRILRVFYILVPLFPVMSEEYSNVKVCVRCRPVFKGESTYHGGRKFLNIGERELRISDNEGKHPRVFNFDKVFSECSNEDVYVDCVRNLVEGCFIGLNATVLACKFMLCNSILL